MTDAMAARFPHVAARAGHYESFYVKAADPDGGRAIWLRHTVHKPPGGEAVGSVWLTVFDRSADGPAAIKATLPPAELGAPAEGIRVGDSVLRADRAAGRIGDEAAWGLALDGDEPPLLHLPRPWMYGAPVPRTKLLSPRPALRVAGAVELRGARWDLDGWPAVLGHNWGAQHAERWIWLHAALGDRAWVDLAFGRVQVGPVVTPWIANGVLSLDGERLRLGGIERTRATVVDEAPTACRFVCRGPGVRVTGVVDAPRAHTVAWRYADPGGGEHQTLHCSIADLRLCVERGGRMLELRCDGAAAYELGMRETDHGIPVQPYADPAAVWLTAAA